MAYGNCPTGLARQRVARRCKGEHRPRTGVLEKQMAISAQEIKYARVCLCVAVGCFGQSGRPNYTPVPTWRRKVAMVKCDWLFSCSCPGVKTTQLQGIEYVYLYR